MYSPPNIMRMAKLRIDGLPLGSSLLYCHECDYQIANAAHKPECPQCGGNKFYTTTLTPELVNAIKTTKTVMHF